MKVTDDQLIDAIMKNAGIVSGIMATLKKEYGIEITRNGIYERKYANPKIAEAFEEAENVIADVAENRLVEAIRNGNFKAVTFYLKTKAKSRGYTERQEVVGANGEPIQVTDPLAGLSKEELMKIAGLTDALTNESKDKVSS